MYDNKTKFEKVLEWVFGTIIVLALILLFIFDKQPVTDTPKPIETTIEKDITLEDVIFYQYQNMNIFNPMH